MKRTKTPTFLLELPLCVKGQSLPRSMGVVASGKAARAGARRLKSPAYPHQEPVHPQGATGSVG
jgi:hypothetical protein